MKTKPYSWEVETNMNKKDNNNLNSLKDEVYKDQFFDYEEIINAKVVLEKLQDLKNNSKLLNYVIQCLAAQGIETKPNKFYYVIVNSELRMPYNKKIHKTFENYTKHCVDGDFGLKKSSHQLDKVFKGISEIEDYMIKNKGESIIGFGHTKFEKYSIHEIGVL